MRWRRSGSGASDGAGHLVEAAQFVQIRFQDGGRRRLAFTSDHAVNGALGMFEDLLGGKRCAVAPSEHGRAGPPLLRRAAQLNDFGNVGQVVHAKTNASG